MRWGEPTRLPPLRRGRGLTAAALLTVGLVAAYVVLGVLSLTSVAPSTLLKSLPRSVAGIGGGSVPANTPKVQDVVGTPFAAASLDTLVVDLGFATGTSDPLSQTFVLKNTAAAPGRPTAAP